MKIDEEFVINKYSENESTYSIAKELGTYPKKIERILKKNNIELRSKSESQKLALKAGRCEHPTKGKREQKKKRSTLVKEYIITGKIKLKKKERRFPEKLNSDGTKFLLIKSGT